MFNNLLGDIDATWIIIAVVIFLLLAGDDDECGDGGFLGNLSGIFEGNMIIIILLLLLLFIDI